MKLIVIFLMTWLSCQAQSLQEQVNELDHRLTDLELVDFARKFTIQGNFINHWETYASDVKNDDGSTDGHSIYIVSSILELDFNFKLTSKLNFYSRLGMSKLWNADNNNGDNYQHSETDDSWDTSNQGSFGYWGSSPKFDRAYLSYNFLNEKANFSIGRMSTHKGPPSHQQFGEERTGTYPRLVYNAIFDGVAFTGDLSSYLPKSHQLQVRFLYSPFVNLASDSRNEKRKDENSAGDKVTAKPMTDQYTFQIEYSKEFKNYFTLNLIYFYYKYSDFYQYVPDEDIYIWNAHAHTMYLGLDNIANKKINVNVSYLNLNEGGLTSGDDEYNKYKSYGWLYGLNWEFLPSTIIGGEYIDTSKDYYVDDWTYYTISDFYRAPNSSGYHAYFTFPLFDLTKLKIGYFDYNTKGSITFDADSSAKSVRSVYATMQTTF